MMQHLHIPQNVERKNRNQMSCGQIRVSRRWKVGTSAVILDEASSPWIQEEVFPTFWKDRGRSINRTSQEKAVMKMVGE
jgi:hypothetical protein